MQALRYECPSAVVISMAIRPIPRHGTRFRCPRVAPLSTSYTSWLHFHVRDRHDGHNSPLIDLADPGQEAA